jgi:hypothetical protein
MSIQAGDEESVRAVVVRESLNESPAVRRELRMRGQEVLHLALVLGLADGARRVHEPPARAHGLCTGLEDPPLQRPQLLDLFRSLAPADIRP